MTTTVGLSVLVKDTGESARTLQHWSDLGILKPVTSTHKQGRGYHREFPAAPPWHGERTWALFASHLNRIRIPLGDIKLIIDSLRPFTTDTAALGEPPIGWQKHLQTHSIGQALSGRLVVLLIGIDENKEVRCAEILGAPSAEAIKEVEAVFPKGTISDKEDFTIIKDIDASIPWEFIGEFASNYMLNLEKVFAPLTGAQS
ncbi:hypothetical protein [Lichenihabitans psoromatis]|uniref:hypothetical protein n=1 Tax=Lichenihabitans psoromatis TaxID=2528642 RepID=UPI00103835D0|nr:hypothetical protein [Lichenihabitans psoromatis]